MPDKTTKIESDNGLCSYPKIRAVNLAVTNRCNLQCRYCDIWKERVKKDMHLGMLEKVLDSVALDENCDIALTGGEPFLHPFLPALTETILKKRPFSLKTISTNGSCPAGLQDFLRRFRSRLPKDFSVHVSYDGENATGRVRGIDHRALLKTLVNISACVPVKLKFTISSFNYRQIIPAWKMARRNRWRIAFKLVETARNYTNRNSPHTSFSFTSRERTAIAKDLRKISVHASTQERLFLHKIVSRLAGGKDKVLCATPWTRIFVMPDGKVFSCLHEQSIGIMKISSLDRIWHSRKAETLREYIKDLGCKGCLAHHGRLPEGRQ